MAKGKQSKDDSEIVGVVFERDDPFYDSVASIWNLDLYHLDKDGQESSIFVSGHDFPDIVDKFDKEYSKSKSFIKTEDKRYVQYGRYVYLRKSLFKEKKMKDYIELTEEKLANLNSKNIIAVTVAEEGAMGDPGAIEIVDRKLNIYHVYPSKIDSKILYEKIPFLEKLELVFGNIIGLDEKKWSGLYTGFGNYLFVRPKYKQPLVEFLDKKYNKHSKTPKAESYAHRSDTIKELTKTELYVHWYDALKEIINEKNS